MRHRAKSTLGDDWVYGRYAFVDGYHVIYEESKVDYPIVIKYATLEKA